MERNGKKFEDPSETPEEIVGLIGNIGNRPDIRDVQERQVREIKSLIAAEKMDRAGALINVRKSMIDKAEKLNNEGTASGTRCATILLVFARELADVYAQISTR